MEGYQMADHVWECLQCLPQVWHLPSSGYSCALSDFGLGLTLVENGAT
jgi:hypothetical protein